MAQVLTVNSLKAELVFGLRNDNALAPLGVNPTLSIALSLADGLGLGAADRIYLSQRTLAASASENLDLAGSLTDPLGSACVFARIKFLLVFLRITPAAASSILVGGHATAALGNWLAATPDLDTAQPKVRVRGGGAAGGFLALGCTDATGYAVAATTEDLLTITNADGVNAATYDIAIGGCSA